MKGLALALTLAVSLGFSACSKRDSQVVPSTPQAVAVASERPTQGKLGSHECGAITKSTGLPCTRKVSDKHGKDARCWQHQ